jgi:hypothetical protein
MVSKIVSRLGPEENAFVVCGSEHLAGLQRLLVASRQTVKTENIALDDLRPRPVHSSGRGFLMTFHHSHQTDKKIFTRPQL